MTTRRLAPVTWLWLSIGLAAACQDPAVKLGPEHQVMVTNQPGMFRLQVSDMDNVIDDTSFTWVATDSVATILHRSLVPHGVADILIRDATGAVVYSGSLVYETDSKTSKGAPGSWTIDFEIKAATGKIDVTVQTP